MVSVCIILVLLASLSRLSSSFAPGLGVYQTGPWQLTPSDFMMSTNISIVHRLVWNIFAQYHKAAAIEKPVIVDLDVLLLKVKGTIEKEGIFESVLAIFVKWHDHRLEWNPADYGNITSLSMEPEQIGVPDIAMKNSADELYFLTRHNKFTVRLNYKGQMKYVPTGTARTWCDFKLFTFPFDVQQCSLEFESWSHNHYLMTFNGKSEIILDKGFVSPLWAICSLKATTYEHTYFTNETFTRVRFDIVVKRKYTFYIVNLIFPCATLSFIQLLVFWIPSTDTTADRIGFSTTNLLTLVVFQTIVTEELPKTSDAVTALSKYIVALIVTSSIGIFESVTVERMFRTFQHPPPMFLYKLFKPLPMLFREVPQTYQAAEESQMLYQKFKRKEAVTASPREAIVTSSMVDLELRPKMVPMSAEEKTRLLMKVGQREDGDEKEESQFVNLGYQNDSPNNCVPPLDLNKSKARKVSSVGLPSDGTTSPSQIQANRLKGKIRRLSEVSLPFHHFTKSGSNKRERMRKKRNEGQVSSLFNNPDQTRNACLWMELAYKIDCATFTAGILFSVFLPLILFVPFLFFGKYCVPSFQLETNDAI